MNPTNIQYQPEICQKHERHFEELWRGQFECLACFEEQHEHIISALEHKDEEDSMMEALAYEGRVD